MPRNQLAASRYAKSIFQLTQSDVEKMDAHQVLEELKALETAINSDTNIKKFFLNPCLSKEEKLEVLKGLSSILKLSFRFVNLLVEADRIDSLGEIIFEYEKLLNEATGELSVELELAQDLPDKSIQQISQILEVQWKRKPKFTIKKNKNLIGGFVAKAPGRTMDASVRSQLKVLQKDLAIN